MNQKLKTYHILTYGCSMNYADSERISTILEDFGLYEVNSKYDADVLIFNTCSIKQKAEDKVFGVFNELKKVKKEFPHRKYGLTGCMVKKTGVKDKESPFYCDDEALGRSQYIDFAFRILETSKLPEILELGKSKEENFFQIKQKIKSPVQAIVPIQTGCDNFCTFCIVPFTRGRELSRPMDEILKEIEKYCKKGIKEIILTGQNVNSYGKGMPNTKRKWNEENSSWLEGNEKTPFAILLEKVGQIEGVERIRFQSSNPHDMTDDIIEEILNNKKIMPALHFALQSGNNEVLKRMNRKHTYEKFREIVRKIKSKNPDFSISTDLIVGFCGETESEFEDTLKVMREIEFDMIYISPYSKRKGTFAGDKLEDNIPEKTKNERWHKANNLLKEIIFSKLKSFIGKTQKVLVEKIENGEGEGKTERNYICKFKTKENTKIGDILEIKITGNFDWSLEGEIFSLNQNL